MDHSWTPRERDFAAERERYACAVADASAAHPLLPSYVVSKTPKPAATSDLFDPLSAATAPSDPLSAPTDPLQRTSSTPGGGGAADSAADSRFAPVEEDANFRPWSARKAEILRRYTTNESIAIQVNFLDAPVAPVGANTVDKTQQRLEQLDQSLETQEKEIAKLTQNEYLRHIEDLHAELIHAWDSGNRVKSIKIAIQCAKVLGDVSVIKFYPSKFVLVSEILMTFGNIVFKRIHERALEEAPDGSRLHALPKNWTSDDIPEHAKETCKNWFFKIASIRELVPRLYVEMAIMKCHMYLSTGTFTSIIRRLGRMIRGIGDPVVNAYCHAFLARVGLDILPSFKEHQFVSVADWCQVIEALKGSNKLEKLITFHRLSIEDYFDLFTPALEYIVQSAGHIEGADYVVVNAQKQAALERILKAYSRTTSGMLLNVIISSVPPDMVARNAAIFTTLIREADRSFPKYLLYTTFGAALSLSHPPADAKMSILNEVWKVVSKFDDVSHYLSVAEVFIEYPAKHLSITEVNVLLGDVLRHVKPNNAYETSQSQQQLSSLVAKLLSHYHDFEVLFSKMENLLPLLDLFRDSYQTAVHRSIVESFAKSPPTGTCNPVIVNAVFNSAKAVHDSISPHSTSDDVRAIGRALCAFLHRINYGRDVEKQLQFYTDCRRALPNLDVVRRELVIAACTLSMNVLAIVGGSHNKKTSQFVRATTAFTYITIPSLEGVFERLQLYQFAGCVAHQNGAHSQADSLFKAAITLIQEVPQQLTINGEVRSTERSLVEYLSSFASVLVALPGHPELGGFFLLKGLLKVVNDYPWETPAGKASVYARLLWLLATLAQPHLPYHIHETTGNDLLYGGSSEYQAELRALIGGVVDTSLSLLKKCQDDSDKSVQRQTGRLALELFCATVGLSDLNAQSAALAANLFGLARAGGASQSQLLFALGVLRRHSKRGSVAAELLKKLEG